MNIQLYYHIYVIINRFILYLPYTAVYIVLFTCRGLLPVLKIAAPSGKINPMNRTVYLDESRNALALIDQTLLPGREEVIYLTELEEIREAIRLLKVRGAPAIGVAAAIGLYLEASSIMRKMGVAASWSASIGDFFSDLRAAKDRLNSARPTAVNLSWALNRMERVALRESGDSDGSDLKSGDPGDGDLKGSDPKIAPVDHAALSRIVARMKSECLAMLDEDEAVCAGIGRHGLGLLRPGMGILTHCNAGRLATASKYGTATAPIYCGHEQGYRFKVYCDETRPLLQGARLTAYELCAAGVDTTLICDNMAPTLMSQGLVGAVLVGCDRVAANGDAANKIGTLYVAIAAKHYGIPFYVCAPSSTLDFRCSSGESIVIEQRHEREVTEMWYAERMAPEGVKVSNPSFDVTGASFITAIITEHGVIRPPYREGLAALKPGSQ